MKFDKDSFSQTLQCFALRVPPKLCNNARNAIKEHTLVLPRVLSVVKPIDANDQPNMLILLKYLAKKPICAYPHAPRGNCDEDFIDAEVKNVAARIKGCKLPPKTSAQVADYIRELPESSITTRKLDLNYSHWPLDSVLRSLLPPDVPTPTSFETIGHIAHLNLRAEHEPYKHQIGEIMLDKLAPRIQTIVNKIKSTGGPYRTFEMEVLAGKKEFTTRVKENGCIFTMDFEKVYWNSRLEGEHRKIVQSIGKDDIVADAFCGIGPFVLPLGKEKRCERVYANDLNPSSVKYLRENLKVNHVSWERVKTSCGCARDFLTALVKERVGITRVIMNFPSGAPEFLDVFRGLYVGWDGEVGMPLVHCYCFVKGATETASARKRVRHALFGEEDGGLDVLGDEEIEVREVRDVAPRKIQVCVTFRVPREVAFGEAPDILEPPEKRARVAVG